MSKLERLGRLSMRDFIVLSQLVGCSCAVAIALRFIGWQRLSQSILLRSRGQWARRFPAFHLNYQIDQLIPLVDMSTAIFPGNRCLVRSMMMLWLLRTRGEPAEVVLGVRKRAGNFEAHAWTLSARGPVGESAAALADFAVMTGSGAVKKP
jgi:Transglutaminase-like superfamily